MKAVGLMKTRNNNSTALPHHGQAENIMKKDSQCLGCGGIDTMSACYRAYRFSAYRLPHGEAISVVLLDTPALFAAEFVDRQQLGLTIDYFKNDSVYDKSEY